MSLKLIVLVTFLSLWPATSQIPGPPSLKRAVDALQKASQDPAALRVALRAAWLSQHGSHTFEEILAKHNTHGKSNLEVLTSSTF